MNMRAIFSLSILLATFTFQQALAQIPDYTQNCPAYSCKMSMDTNSFIPVVGEIHLGSGIITRDNSGSGTYAQYRTMDYRIPCNKPSVAIAMAHGWQLYRNMFKVQRYDINTFSGILINETSGGACQPPSSLDFSCYPTSAFPFQNAYADYLSDYGSGGGVAVTDGCYQIDGQGRQTLKEWLGTTSCGIYADATKTAVLITGNQIETATLSRVYYDFIFARRVQYKLGVDPLPVIAATNDPLGLYKLSAAAYNQGMDGTLPKADRIFNTNRALAISSNNWFDPLLLGANGYAQACAHYVDILSNNYTPAAGDLQQWTGWYDYNISWAEMDSYMTTVFPMFLLTTTEETTIRAKVKTVFDQQKNAAGKVSFRYKFGPVVDKLVKLLPYYDPTNTINNSQMGAAGCKGCIGPVVRITANTPITVCKGIAVELETVVGTGYTYYWLKDGVQVTNTNSDQHIFYATQSGVYDVVVKDDKGCAIRSDGAVTVTVDNSCSSCDLTAAGTMTNNSCTGIKDGKIVVSLSGTSYNSGKQYDYNWTFPDNSYSSITSNTLNNISNGYYMVEVVDHNTPACRAYKSFKITETTPFYQSLQLSKTNPACDKTQITAKIIDNPPTTCTYNIQVQGIPDGTGKCWGNTWIESDYDLGIKVNGASLPKQTPGDPASGGCVNLNYNISVNDNNVIELTLLNKSASNFSSLNFKYILTDPLNNQTIGNLTSMSFPAGTEKVVLTKTASCTQPTPSFNFTWTPSSNLSGITSTSLTSTALATVTANKQYTIEAVSPTKPACVLKETITADYSCPGGLPVEWIAFNAFVNKDQIDLFWTTAKEVNCYLYIIERSTNGHDFLPIGSIMARGTISQYYFVDRTPLDGTAYYRIKQIDYDGKYSYSIVKAVSINNHPAFYVYPNPSEETFTIQASEILDNNIIQYQLTDVSGRTLEQASAALSLNTNLQIGSSIPSGIYILKIITTDTEYIFKLVKE